MDLSAALGVIWLIGFVAFVVFIVRKKRFRGRIGPGAAGSVYDLLSEDKRKAIELIVEQRAEERRPEYADGNLPDLDEPKGPTR